MQGRLAGVVAKDESHAPVCWLGRVQAHHQHAAFASRVTGLLPQIIRCDTCTYNEIDLIAGTNTAVTYPDEGRYPDHSRVFSAYMHEHPVLRAYLELGPRGHGASKISDFMSDSEFTKLGLYNEYFRRLGLKRQIGISVAFSGRFRGATIAFNRAGPDFGERDRIRLNMLRPHVVQATRNIELLGRLEADLALATHGLEVSNRAQLALVDHAGGVRYMSPGMRRLFGERFGERSLAGGRLPEDVERWLRRSQAALSGLQPPEPIVLGHGGRRFAVRFVSNADGTIVFVDEPPRTITPEVLGGLGLTPREADVLTWICRGKTNADIGEILDISRRTVEKHVERILVKLGVETRTAAVSVVGSAWPS